VQIERLRRLHVTTLGRVIGDETLTTTRGCPQEISTHTDADFTGGAFVIQQGFAETEIAAASYTLTADKFPLRIDMMEMIFAQQSVVETTTHWSVLVWQGRPDTGTLVAEFSSDDVTLPHLVMPPGTVGTDIAVSVDPGDPAQIIIDDDGSQTFTIGYRIDMHNDQRGTGCGIGDIPANRNAFPVTDVSGLASPTQNWIRAIDCGPLGCPSGWRRFSQLGLCEPSGDWVIRATWTPLNCTAPTGACCLSDGSCLDAVTQSDCETVLGGTWQGAGSDCATSSCPAPTGACCFGDNCLELTAGDCATAGGTFLGAGTTCDGTGCPTGACCLTDGTCVDGQTQAGCEAMGGTFEGVGTTCATVSCPEPTGACCFDTGGCLELIQSDCTLAGGNWQGAGTTCADVDGDGIADACQGCVGDINGDGSVDVGDFFAFVVAFATGDPAADLNGDGSVDVGDFFAFVLAFEAGCP